MTETIQHEDGCVELPIRSAKAAFQDTNGWLVRQRPRIRHLARRPADSRRWSEERKTEYVQSYWIAITHAGFGDQDAAFAELERSYQNRDWFLQRLKTDPFVEPLRGDPRYNEMLKRLNLPE